MALSAMETAENPIEIWGYLDEDDPAIDEYLDTDTVQFYIGPRITLSDCWNKLAQRATGQILHLAADDIRFRTPGWDSLVRNTFDEFKDKIAFVYGRDGIHDGKLGTHGFISRRWMETLGYFTWPDFPADFADTWLHDLALRIGRAVYLPELLIEHLHPIAGKAQWDRTHLERLRRAKETDLYARFAELTPQRIADAEKLEAACF